MFHDLTRGSGESRQFAHATQKIINLLHKVIYLKVRNAVDEIYSAGSLLGNLRFSKYTLLEVDKCEQIRELVLSVTFSNFRVPSNFLGNVFVQLYTEGLEARVEPSVLQQLRQAAHIRCKVIPHCIVCFVAKLFS